jgi:hypothetical protein
MERKVFFVSILTVFLTLTAPVMMFAQDFTNGAVLAQAQNRYFVNVQYRVYGNNGSYNTGGISYAFAAVSRDAAELEGRKRFWSNHSRNTHEITSVTVTRQ